MTFAQTKPLNRITAWSFSRWNTYQQCPYKAKLQFIDKHKTEESEAQLEGQRFHKLCQAYLKSRGGQVPKALKSIADGLQQLRKDKAQAEVSWAFNKDWVFVEWYAEDAWVRIKIDALVMTKGRMQMVDFKTGKERDKDLEQLSLYALAAFQLDPTIKEVSAELWYTKTGNIVPMVFERKELKALVKQWATDTRAMLNDDVFAKNPSILCDWCDYNKPSGRGLCEFGHPRVKK